jgi:hypothetical protein
MVLLDIETVELVYQGGDPQAGRWRVLDGPHGSKL